MRESFQADALFWIPDKPDTRISGRVNYTFEDGITIDLEGCFEEQESVKIDDLPNAKAFRTFFRVPSSKKMEIQSRPILDIPVLYGYTIDSKPFTVYGSIVRPCLSWGAFTLERFTCRPRKLVIGCHELEEKNILISELSFSFAYLSEFLSITGIKYERGCIRKLDDICIPLYSGDNAIETYNKVNMSVVNQIEREYYAKESWALRIKFGTPSGLDLVIAYMHQLRNLFVLLNRKSSPVFSLNAKSADNDIIQIYWNQPFQTVEESIADEMYCKYADIKDSVQYVIEKWFSLAEERPNFIHTYFDLIGRENMYDYPSACFIELIASLEAFYNYQSGKKKCRKELGDIILDCVRGFHEILLINDVEQYKIEVMNLRDHYIHRDRNPGRERNIAPLLGKLTVMYNMRLRMLLDLVVLDHIGIYDLIKSSLQHHRVPDGWRENSV